MTEPSNPEDDLPTDFDRRVAAVGSYLESAAIQPIPPPSPMVIVHLKPWFWSSAGIVLGVVSTVAWILTFEPHGGVELSRFLFPGVRWVIQWLHPVGSVPVLLWYGCTFLHWPIIGAFIDLFRFVIRRWRIR